MRSVTTPTDSENTKESQSTDIKTFSTTLSDGRVISIREMTGRDLIYMEEELGKFGETRQSFYLVEKLNVGPDKISFDEIADLKAKDLKKISELVKKANDGDEEGEDPK